MKRAVRWDPPFKRIFKKHTQRNERLERRIYETIAMLSDDAFQPKLETHKLKGKLSGFWACTVEYDCRLVFNFRQEGKSKEETIVLVDIGTHDDVY